MSPRAQPSESAARELLIGGPSRYATFQRVLPGIATNLLADRLRDLESAGVIERADVTFALTARGRDLEPLARARGARLDGDRQVLRRLQPLA